MTYNIGNNKIKKLDQIREYLDFYTDSNIIIDSTGVIKNTKELEMSDNNLTKEILEKHRNYFTRFLTSLLLLEEGGTLIFRMTLQLNNQPVNNLLYLAYQHFDDLVVHRSLSLINSQGFYLIGKGYHKIPNRYLNRFLPLVEDFSIEADFYLDQYPENFVSQLTYIHKSMANNYIQVIDNTIFYFDHFKIFDQRMIEVIKDFVLERRLQWLKTHKIKRMLI